MVRHAEGGVRELSLFKFTIIEKIAFTQLVMLVNYLHLAMDFMSCEHLREI